MVKEMQIHGHKIGKDQIPFIVAEMSGNHNQSLERALEIVDAASDSGAHAIKLQTYTADTMTMKGAHTIQEEGSIWYGRELHELYKEAYTPWEWHKPIMKRAKERGIICFSSPFDESAVDFLESLQVPAYKIASFENTHHPLLIKVAKTGKPVIMSTGVSTVADIDESVRVLKDNGCKELILLKCTSTYPASPENSNLLTIPHMVNLFDCQIGLSDHTAGIGTAITAVALGAVLIEKHFTLSRADGGVDSVFSLEPEELKHLVVESKRAYLSLGKIDYGVQDVEKKNRKYKRSIYITRDIDEGEIFTNENISVLRPGDGMEPKYYFTVLGKTARQKIKAGTPLTFNMF